MSDAVVTDADVVAAARRRKGVRFHHQGRGAAGIDCAGVLIVVARELGLVPPDFDVTAYARSPDGSMRRLCDERLIAVPGPEFGGVVLMRMNERPREQHIGLVGRAADGALTLIHADDVRARCVSEVHLQFGRHMSLVQAYRLPGVLYAGGA
jgi:hypothetical protein